MEWMYAVKTTEIESKVEGLNEKVSRLTEITDGLFSKLINFGMNLLVAILIFAIGKVVLSMLRKFIKNILSKSKVDIGVIRFADSIIKVLGYIVILIIICGQIGIQTTSFITLLGTAGLSIGLALQGSFSNFAGGVLILVSKPFVVDDYIILDHVEGKVDKIDIIYTTLITVDNKIVKIPNGTVANSVLINTTHQAKRRVDVEVGIHYDDDIAKAKNVANEVMAESAYILENEANVVVVKRLDESSIVLEVRMWVASENYWNAKFYLNEHLRIAFDQNGIRIPYNQLDVNVHQGE